MSIVREQHFKDRVSRLVSYRVDGHLGIGNLMQSFSDVLSPELDDPSGQCVFYTISHAVFQKCFGVGFFSVFAYFIS